MGDCRNACMTIMFEIPMARSTHTRPEHLVITAPRTGQTDTARRRRCMPEQVRRWHHGVDFGNRQLKPRGEFVSHAVIVC